MTSTITATTVPGLPGTVTHHVSDDGLTLTSTYRTAAGTLTGTVSWGDLGTARAHYQVAQQQFETRVVTRFHTKIGQPNHDGDTRRLRRVATPLGTVYLGANTGPPTWWLPRADAGWRTNDGEFVLRLMVGWYRACTYAKWQPNRPGRVALAVGTAAGALTVLHRARRRVGAAR